MISSNSKLVNVTPVRPADRWPTGARTRVRVYNVNSEAHVASVPTPLPTCPPRKTHRCFAAAIMEKLDVRASKVPVRHAVDQIVETGFGEGEPGQVVQDTWAYRFERVEAHDYAER